MGECLFWYRPTRVVPDQRLLNGCVCVCVRACVCVCVSVCRGALSDTAIRPSVCPSVCIMAQLP